MNRQRFESSLGKMERQQGQCTSDRRRVLQRLVRQAGAAYIITHGKITGYRLPDGSVVCRKKRYQSAQTAATDLQQIAFTTRHAHIPVRAYPCDRCHGFHLTSLA